jgi:hypothetical protein
MPIAVKRIYAEKNAIIVLCKKYSDGYRAKLIAEETRGWSVGKMVDKIQELRRKCVWTSCKKGYNPRHDGFRLAYLLEYYRQYSGQEKFEDLLLGTGGV